MEEILKQLLGEKQAGWLALLTDKAGFTLEQAKGFLGPALEQVLGALKGGQLDLGALLGGSVDEVVSKLDVAGLASQAELDGERAEQGLKELLPDVGATLKEQSGALEGLGDLLGGSGGGLKGIVGKLLG